MLRYAVETNTTCLKYYEQSRLGGNTFSPINLIQLHELNLTYTDSLLAIL